MKRLLLLTLSLILVLACSALADSLLPVPGSPVSGSSAFGAADKSMTAFTFDTDNQGWLMTYVGIPGALAYETLYTNGPADHTTTEGLPPGSIFQQVTSDINQRAYWLGYISASPQFLGDLSDASLVSDVYSTANWQTLANGASGDDGNVYARWVISKSCTDGTYDMFISNRAASIDLNSFTGWQNFSVILALSNFFRWPNAICGNLSFEEVLLDYDQVGLYVFSGTDDILNINGGTGTWGTVDGKSRLMHYGAFATSGDGVWGVDNLWAEGNSVPVESTSFGSVKALFR